MKPIARKSDGRRIFTAEFKLAQIKRVLSGELTLTELSKKLGIARSLLQRWKRVATENSVLKGVRSSRKTPPGVTHDAAYVRELQLLVGKQGVELEFLRADVDALRVAGGPRRPRGR